MVIKPLVVHLPNGSVRQVSQAYLARCQEADRLRSEGLNNRQIGERLGGVSKKTVMWYFRILKYMVKFKASDKDANS